MATHIYYNDNKTYREFLRTFFKMDVSNMEIADDDSDDESFDELLFDNDACKKTMETIFQNTHQTQYFADLYKKAASRMFSEDQEIGLAILCCYDHLWLFKIVYEKFLENPDSIGDDSVSMALFDKI